MARIRSILPLLVCFAAQGPAQETAPGADDASSLFTAPLFLAEEPPEGRAVRVIELAATGTEGRRVGGARTLEEALDLADRLVLLLRAGSDFLELSRAHSVAPGAASGGVLGVVPPGVLDADIDRFLFDAGVGEISAPIVTPRGVLVCQRIEGYAACRQIYVRGQDASARARAQEAVRRARAGEVFEDLARELSDDAPSAEAGGAWRIFERGPTDRLLKLAAFTAREGEVFGPLETPLGFHVGKRVPLDELGEEYRESGWVRGRALFVAQGDGGDEPQARRSPEEARARVLELHERLKAGRATLEQLAREVTDEPTARDRGGDLGWLHRNNPRQAREVQRLFTLQVGQRTNPVPLASGWVILERTR